MMARQLVTRRAALAGLAGAVLAPSAARALTVTKGTVVGKDGWLYLVWDDPRKADPERMRRVTKVIGDAAALLHGAKIDVVIALTPAKARVYREFLPEDFTFTPEADRRYGAAAEQMRQAGMLVPDLAKFFATLRQSNPQEKIFFQSDTHWTAFGAESAAGEVGRQMSGALHLPPASRPGSVFDRVVTMSHINSDLSGNLPAAEQPQHPPEAYPMHHLAVPRTSTALIEEDSSDVVVVGNSYMQPKYNFAPALSATLNRPVGLVWKVHLVGPYKTMLNYLGSEQFRRERPKAIVWNFHEIDMELPADSQAAWTQDAMSNEAFIDAVQKAVRA